MNEESEQRRTYSLLLFVSGASPSSTQAIRHVRAICEELGGRCSLTVIDVNEDVELARERRVLATPTLIRERPELALMRVGDFSDHQSVLASLDLVADRPRAPKAAVRAVDE